MVRLNAPTGAWRSLTKFERRVIYYLTLSQCIYRCVTLSDDTLVVSGLLSFTFSMHLQVRGAP